MPLISHTTAASGSLLLGWRSADGHVVWYNSGFGTDRVESRGSQQLKTPGGMQTDGNCFRRILCLKVFDSAMLGVF